MKKILYTAVSVCLVLAMLVPYITAFAGAEPVTEWQGDTAISRTEPLAVNPGDAVEPLATGLISGKDISITNNGNLITIRGYVRCTAEVVRCGFSELIIQRKDLGSSSSSWSDYRKYKDLCIDASNYELKQDDAVPFGYVYRVTCTAYARRNLLSTQKVTLTSNTVTVVLQ